MGVDSLQGAHYRSFAMKLLLLFGLVAACGVCGCGTFSGAGESAVQNLEQGVEEGGRIVSPDPMGNEFGSYFD